MKKELEELKAKLEKISTSPNKIKLEPTPTEIAVQQPQKPVIKKLPVQGTPARIQQPQQIDNEEEYPDNDEIDEEIVYPTEAENLQEEMDEEEFTEEEQPRVVQRQPQRIIPKVPIQQKLKVPIQQRIQQGIQQRKIQRQPLSVQKTEEELVEERLQQLEVEKTRLARDEGAYRVEIVYVLHQINENLIKLISVLNGENVE